MRLTAFLLQCFECSEEQGAGGQASMDLVIVSSECAKISKVENDT